jgi:FSR family fosmidomycin resistance protein-like MFS transporter
MTDPKVSSESSRQAPVWPTLLALATGHFAVDCCTGIWPVFKTLAHLDLARAGLIATVGAVIGNGSQILFGLLADGGWRRPLLLVGVMLAGAVTFVTWTDSYAAMFALVLATYLGSAAFHPSGTGAAAAISHTRTGVMVGLFFAGGFAGYALSQILFSAIYVRTATLTPLLTAIPLVAAIGIAWRVSDTPSPHRSASTSRALLGERWPTLATLFFIQVFATAINLAVIFLLPDLMLARGAPAWMVSGGSHFAMILGSCLALLPAGHAADRFGARRVLCLANLATGVLLAWLLSRPDASPLDLVIVMAFGAFNGMNNVVTVAEGNRMLPGHPSSVSAVLMGLPWCLAASASLIAGLLADPTRGGTPTRALAWLGLAIPLALAASAAFRPARAMRPGAVA